MSTVIDALVITLGLDSSNFKKNSKEISEEMKKQRKDAEKMAKDMEAAGKRAASFFGSIRTELLALVGVTLSVQGFKSFVTNMTNNLQQLAISSRSLDMSAKSLDGWQHAAAAAGSSAEKITGTLSAFQNTLTNIRTGGAENDPLFGALANFGAATGANFDFDKDNSEAIMRKIAQNWNKLSEDAKRRFGSLLGFDNATQQGLSNGNILRDADRYREMSRATEEATRKAQEFNRRVEDLKQNFAASSQVLYESLIPYVEKLIPLFEKLGNWISGHGPEINKFFSDAVVEVNKLVDMVGGWQNALGAVAIFIAGSWLTSIAAAFAKIAKIPGPPWLMFLMAYAGYAANDSENISASASSSLSYAKRNVGDALRKMGIDTDYGRDGNTVMGTPDVALDIPGNQPVAPPKATKAGAALLGFMSTQFAQLEAKYGLPSGLLKSVATTESGGNQYAISSAGAKGMFQFMDGTAKDLGLSGSDVFDPSKSAEAAARYLKQLLTATGGNLSMALGAYNWGIGNLKRKGIENAPDETLNYIPKVLAGVQLGAGVSASRNPAYGNGGGSRTDIHINEVNMQTSATTANALGNELNRNVQRNRLVTPAMSGQG